MPSLVSSRRRASSAAMLVCGASGRAACSDRSVVVRAGCARRFSWCWCCVCCCWAKGKDGGAPGARTRRSRVGMREAASIFRACIPISICDAASQARPRHLLAEVLEDILGSRASRGSFK